MGIGPLESFVFPGVLTRTVTEASGATFSGDLRFPGFVGIAAEEIRVSDYEMVRGSSAISDNLILDEDVSSQLDGTNKTFTVENFPVVNGDGNGTVATLPKHVIVTINGEPTAVSTIDGLTGQITLQQIPEATDDVRANYYFKRRDTFIENEDLSAQADGSNLIFKVKSDRIVKGDNGGTSATDADIDRRVTILYDPSGSVVADEFLRTVDIIKVEVDSGSGFSEVTISELDGSTGTFTLAAAPAGTSSVRVSYFTNTWQDTYDILPAPAVTRLIQVGLSQDTSDFSIGNDCVLANGNRIHWGHSKSLAYGVTTAGSPLDITADIVASLSDTRVYGVLSVPATPATDAAGTVVTDASGNILNSDNNATFVLPTTPVDGGGTGIPTEDPADVIAYVGTTWTTALASGPVTVSKIDGRNVTLGIPTSSLPSATNEYKVYVTYHENLLVDDTWTLTIKEPGGSGVGKYTIESNLNGTALDVVQVGGTVTPVYAGAGSFNAQVNPLKASPERVTVTFTSTTAFTISSTGRSGSGTDNTGVIGKTYIDEITGFRVTFSGTGFSPSVGNTVVYDVGDPTAPSGEQDYLTAKTDFVRAIPGINLTVSSIDGGSVDITDNTVILSTYNKSGNEPTVGDNYYVTFDKAKTDYSIKFMTEMRDVIKTFGPIDITNKLVVAANLAFQNGARAVALKQIRKTSGGTDASVQDYINGIDAFNEPLPNGLRPSLLQALSTDSQVHSYLKSSNATQSSIRYRNERTSIIGFAAGTASDDVISRVKALGSEKVTAVYPDAAILGITDSFGNEVEYLVGGEMIASAVAGLDVSPVSDIATPLTNKSIVGFKRLFRRLDNVTAALVANAGCTVLEEQTPEIRILMYLTTNMSNNLTRNPRIVEVKHFVQQGVRRILQRYIGVKNLPRVIPQIESTLRSYFKTLRQAEIIVDFTGIRATVSEADPSTIDVEAYYSPVFPVNWIVVTLNLRSTL